jgi:ubiquinone biosynthesis protein UbiJ
LPKPLVTAGIETLNTFLYRAPGAKAARQRLLKVLRIELKEFSTPLVLVSANASWTCWARGKVRPTAGHYAHERAAKTAQSPAAYGAYPQR